MAIQQADKLLKKHKDLHCAKVRSFALELLVFGGLYIIILKGKNCEICLVTLFFPPQVLYCVFFFFF